MSRSGQYSRVIATLGHGISLQQQYHSQLAHSPMPNVDYMGLSSDDFVHPTGPAWRAAENIREQMPVSLHGRNLGLGNQGGPLKSCLRDLRTLVERLEPVLVSDLLAWNCHAGRYCHEALPLPRTAQALRRTVENIQRAQEGLKRRILVENVASYVEFFDNEMPEAEFLSQVAHQADCWILLNVGNVHINATNHGFEPEAFIAQLPAHRVQQLHLTSYTRDEDNDEEPLLVDTRDGPIPESVWGLYRSAIEHCGDTPSIVEWKSRVPPLARVVQESTRARDISSETRSIQPLRASA